MTLEISSILKRSLESTCQFGIIRRGVLQVFSSPSKHLFVQVRSQQEPMHPLGSQQNSNTSSAYHVIWHHVYHKSALHKGRKILHVSIFCAVKVKDVHLFSSLMAYRPYLAFTNIVTCSSKHPIGRRKEILSQIFCIFNCNDTKSINKRAMAILKRISYLQRKQISKLHSRKLIKSIWKQWDNDQCSRQKKQVYTEFSWAWHNYECGKTWASFIISLWDPFKPHSALTSPSSILRPSTNSKKESLKQACFVSYENNLASSYNWSLINLPKKSQTELGPKTGPTSCLQ